MTYKYKTLINKVNIRRTNQVMWSDHPRNLALTSFIDSVDLKNKILLDAGSGWGILSEYALEKGAKHVVQIECLADRVALLNRWKEKSKFKDKITVLETNLLSEWEWPSSLPEPDFILHEFFGRRILNENLHKILPQLYRKFPNSKFIPDCAQFKVHYLNVSDNTVLFDSLMSDYLESSQTPTFSPGVGVSNSYIDFIQSEIDAAFRCNIFWTKKEKYMKIEEIASYTDEKEIFPVYFPNHPTHIISHPPHDFVGFCMLSYCFGIKDAMYSSGSLNISNGLVSYIDENINEITFTYTDRNNWWIDDWDVSCK